MTKLHSQKKIIPTKTSHQLGITSSEKQSMRIHPRIGMSLSILVVYVLCLVPEQVSFFGFPWSSGEMPLEQHPLAFSVQVSYSP